MIFVLFSIVMAFFIAFLVYLLTYVLSTLSFLKLGFDREKSSAFECGFDPKGSARMPFSMRFFLLAVIFLIFDVELVLLMPFVFYMFYFSSVFSFFFIFSFLFVLLFGLFHEWREGSLDWIG